MDLTFESETAMYTVLMQDPSILQKVEKITYTQIGNSETGDVLDKLLYMNRFKLRDVSASQNVWVKSNSNFRPWCGAV
jgi:hypothetical protein